MALVTEEVGVATQLLLLCYYVLVFVFCFYFRQMKGEKA